MANQRGRRRERIVKLLEQHGVPLPPEVADSLNADSEKSVRIICGLAVRRYQMFFAARETVDEWFRARDAKAQAERDEIIAIGRAEGLREGRKEGRQEAHAQGLARRPAGRHQRGDTPGSHGGSARRFQ